MAMVLRGQGNIPMNAGDGGKEGIFLGKWGKVGERGDRLGVVWCGGGLQVGMDGGVGCPHDGSSNSA